jgi:ribosomal protein L18E
MTIDKKEISLPEITRTLVYNGMVQAPKFEASELYTVLVTAGKSVGFYKVSFVIKDERNYRFAEEVSAVYYEIKPRPVRLKINPDLESYTLISGSIIEGDDLMLNYERRGGFVYLSSANKNYSLSVDPYEIKQGADAAPFIALLILFVLIFLLLLLLITRKRRLKALLISAAGGHGECVAPLSRMEKAILAVDETHANSVLSDSVAKQLLEYSDERIKTAGKGWCYVNVDTLSRSFESGSTVDINSMKEHGIIPKGALCVKVLGGGIIDKPLKVKANKFSASAIKMVALTGGEAIKTKTARIKNP